MKRRKTSKDKIEEQDKKDFKDNKKVSKFVVHEHAQDDVYHSQRRNQNG